MAGLLVGFRSHLFFYSLKSFSINSPLVKEVSIPISVMKNDTDTGSMQKEVMSGTEQVVRKRNDIEKDDTERKRKLDTSHLEGLLFNKTVNHFEAKSEIDLSSGNTSKHFPVTRAAYMFLIGRLRIIY